MRPGVASAVRLLFAATQSLEEVEGTSDYYAFFKEVEESEGDKLCIREVMEFLRLALDVPAGEFLLLMPLVDEAHSATGLFGGKTEGPVVHPEGPVRHPLLSAVPHLTASVIQ